VTTGERTTGERTTGERTTGERTTGERTTGERTTGERAAREGLRDPFADPFAGRPARTPERRPLGEGRVPGEIGIWVFILGDMLIFGLLFVVFVHERSRSIPMFERAHQTMSLTFGAVNTVLLLTGSLFVVLGLGALRHGTAALGSRMFLLTLLCGVGFVVNKYLEYSDKITAGDLPTTGSFYMYYFVLTGIHLLHLLLAMVAMTIMYRVARKPVPAGCPRREDLRLVEAGACFWHLVDLLWIVLFALLYLMR
jgi:nitric oxide reductase NorE protein